ncbi:hypothetical protein [Streptosporangium sp. NPDC000509]|uniref:hypothetical protein n=1 Tax=Streptosporangium sp. NPDC000509 TaxID=3366186 RepID=UPI0036AA9FBC
MAGQRGGVVRIGAALDGLPLAIEPAAARLRSFTVEEIATRLEEYGRFLLRASLRLTDRFATDIRLKGYPALAGTSAAT